MDYPKLSARLVFANGLFFIAMLVIQFVPIPFLVGRVVLAFVALVSLITMIVLVIRQRP
jgi:hypothetical protein